jgi:hypothetical protein
MKFNLEESLTIAENLIAAIIHQENGEKNKVLILKLEATLKCFQHHIKTLTVRSLQ